MNHIDVGLIIYLSDVMANMSKVYLIMGSWVDHRAGDQRVRLQNGTYEARAGLSLVSTRSKGNPGQEKTNPGNSSMIQCYKEKLGKGETKGEDGNRSTDSELKH